VYFQIVGLHVLDIGLGVGGYETRIETIAIFLQVIKLELEEELDLALKNQNQNRILVP
jgi:hypothetical protein